MRKLVPGLASPGLVTRCIRTIIIDQLESASLLPLLGFDASYVSLQQEDRASDATVLRERAIFHFGDELKDFSDTAALISNLDLIISVDTSVAHLAGAMAKPVWILLPFIPDLALAARSRRQPLVLDRPPVSAR